MNKEELKERTSMRDVLSRYGITTDRAGFVHCPFHKGDRTASMKIYKNSYNCFACGANGDIFTFVQQMDNVSFKEAFLFLGGEYEHTKASQLSAYRQNKSISNRAKKIADLELKIRINGRFMQAYGIKTRETEPKSIMEEPSDDWCFYQREFDKCCVEDDYLREELEKVKGGY